MKFISVLTLTVLRATAIMLGWEWFIVPLGVIPIGFLHSYCLLVASNVVADKKIDQDDKTVEYYVVRSAALAITIGIMKILSLFI